jgi:hypothetical protein
MFSSRLFVLFSSIRPQVLQTPTMLNLTATPGAQGIGAANPDVWLSRIFYQQPARHQLMSASANQAPIIRPGTNTFYVPQAGADQTKSELRHTHAHTYIHVFFLFLDVHFS